VGRVGVGFGDWGVGRHGREGEEDGWDWVEEERKEGWEEVRR